MKIGNYNRPPNRQLQYKEEIVMEPERLSEHFLEEHRDGTMWHLSKFFPNNEEVMSIFDSMTREQIYAVSCLMGTYIKT